MAGRIRRRQDLREQARVREAAVQDGTAAEAAPAKKAKAKAPAVKRSKPHSKKAKPRLRARWGVFDAGMKQLAIFDYNQRDAAEEKVTVLRATKKGLFFLQIVKEPMPEPAAAAAP